MPLQLEIIRPTEFIRVGTQGRFDLAASKIALAAVAAACRKRGIQNAALDLRTLQPGPKPVFTSADLIELVNTFPAAGFTRRLRLAILYRSDPHKRARLFAFLSTLHGWNVRAFGDFEAALDWLSRDQEATAQIHQAPAAKKIPIRDYSRRAEPGIRVISVRGRPADRLVPQQARAVAAGQPQRAASSHRRACGTSPRQ